MIDGVFADEASDAAHYSVRSPYGTGSAVLSGLAASPHLIGLAHATGVFSDEASDAAHYSVRSTE